MPVCKNCEKEFPQFAKVDQKRIDCRKRNYCLECNPLGERRFWGGKRVEDNRFKKKKFICKTCGNESCNNSRNLECSTCRNKQQRHEKREKAIQFLGGKCSVCGYDRCFYSLQFHHCDPETKLFGLANSWNIPWKEIEDEMKKCVLVCSNCHGEIHEGLIKI